MDVTRKQLVHTFCHMKDRCYNPNCPSYKDYGGRGISICDEWMENVDRFVEWSVANGYKRGLAIDRIDNDGNYSPDNCRWSTPAENNQNRRSSRYFTLDGKRMNLQQWCDYFCVERPMVEARLKRGWDIRDALTKPKRVRNKDGLAGKRFGRLTVSRYAGVDKFRQTLYECRCVCGNTVIVNSNKLKTGHTQSCGCLQKDVCYKKK